MSQEPLENSVVNRPAWIRTADCAPLLDRVRPFTMVARESLTVLANQVRVLLAAGVPGDFVECGVWKGGAAFLIAELLRRAGDDERKVWLFDSFEGLPNPREVDGAAANEWASQVAGPAYRDNLRVSIEEVQQTALSLGLESRTELVKGWFEHSLPVNRERIGPVALLRIDADWHDSVLCCLENLFEQVVDDGLILLDDYYTWRGCAVAAHEFLGKRGLGFPIEAPIGAGCGMPAVIRKADVTWHELWSRVSALEERRQLIEQLIAAIPAAHAFLLVGQDTLEDGELAGRRVIPFLEKDGAYWGPPEDDATAICEIQRLYEAGARFIAFPSSAFWWLDYYEGFARHLHAACKRLVKNQRVILYDLRRSADGGL